MKSALVAMSGGVDSSVAGLLLKRDGYKVVAVTFKQFETGDVYTNRPDSNCCSERSLHNARKVCTALDIPHYVINRTEDFKSEVIDYFKHSYSEGITPNPCIRCNSRVRWPELIRLADNLGLDFVATGHYARVKMSQGNLYIGRGIDNGKDQSYALWELKPDFLVRTIFPVGSYTKPEIRRLAADNDLATSQTPESQDICFVPEGDYAEFLPKSDPGEIVDQDGKVMGTHTGIAHYTIGQRRGLGIANPEPLYVLGIDKEHNRLIVGTEERAFKKRCFVEQVNWFESIDETITCRVKIRYRHQPATCRVTCTGPASASLEFDEPQRAITPGQSAVFYRDNLVLGGGIIKSIVD